MACTAMRLKPVDLALVRKLNALFGKAFEETDTYSARSVQAISHLW